MPGPRNIRQLLELKHGARFTSNDARCPASIGVASERVLRQDPARIGFLVINLSLNTIHMRPRQAASSSAGMRLDPNGGFLSMNWEEDGEVCAWEWFGIADAAGSALYALETLIAPD